MKNSSVSRAGIRNDLSKLWDSGRDRERQPFRERVEASRPCIDLSRDEVGNDLPRHDPHVGEVEVGLVTSPGRYCPAVIDVAFEAQHLAAAGGGCGQTAGKLEQNAFACENVSNQF